MKTFNPKEWLDSKTCPKFTDTTKFDHTDPILMVGGAVISNSGLLAKEFGLINPEQYVLIPASLITGIMIMTIGGIKRVMNSK